MKASVQEPDIQHLSTWSARLFRGFWRGLRISCIVLVLILTVAAGMIVGLRFWVNSVYNSRIYADVNEIPARPVAIVFGAGVSPSGRPSPVLAARVESALDLYQAGKVRKLLLTGDNRFLWYNEPGAMADYLAERGIPRSDLVLDYAGRRTYDSCYRARHIFGVEEAILVTQNYHLDRALFTCNGLGIDAVGLAANRTGVSLFYWLRELPAVTMAWWDVYVRRPLPVMGEPLPINWDE